MKNMILFSLACLISLACLAQNARNPNIVTILDLGTSADVVGYTGGTRSMVWADDDLKVVVNFHRMGPGATPAGLSGYLGMDIGLNMGKLQTDWTSQVEIQNATLFASPHYYDESAFPSAAIYNPVGNTDPANAYLAYFAANYANLAFAGLGGYGFGTANLVNHADTTKHLRWYNGHPHTYNPDGFTVSKTGIAHMVDLDVNAENGTEVYRDSVIYGRGVWNANTLEFDYTFKTLAFPSVDSFTPADCKIAVSPDGNTVWISVLINLAGATPLIDSTYFPVLRKSTDGGLTWGNPIVVQLDGPNGIQGIKNQYSDYFIFNFFAGPPWPTRDEIPYTTAFDHSLSVDKWGYPHIGVAIGYAPGGYSMVTGVDSLINVYDIFTCDGFHFDGVFMGSLKTFRGTWGPYSSDNRVYISRNKTGDKMFLTWNDTHISGEPDNQHPDVFARGFNLTSCMITSDNGLDGPSMVTFLSAITQEAYWQCTAPIVFTENYKYIIPICTQWFADPTADSRFKYIPDFSFSEADFTIPVIDYWPWYPCGVGVAQKDPEPDPVNVFPNPVKELLTVSINLKKPSDVSVELTNLFGRQVLSRKERMMASGLHQFSLDVASLPPGVYFISVVSNELGVTMKVVVE